MAPTAQRQHEKQAEEHQSPGAHIYFDGTDVKASAQELQGELNEDGADGRTDQYFEPSNDGHSDHQAHLKNEENVGRDNPNVMGKDSASHGRNHSRDGKNQHFVAYRMNSQSGGGLLILTNGADKEPKS